MWQTACSKKDGLSIIERVTHSVDEDSELIEHAFEGSENPKLFKSECKFVGNKTLRVGTEEISAENILISSGGRPKIPKILDLKESG